MTSKQDLLDILQDLDITNYDFIIFKGEDGEGPVSGLLMGTPELIQAVSEGFMTVNEEELDEELEEVDDVLNDFFSKKAPDEGEMH